MEGAFGNAHVDSEILRGASEIESTGEPGFSLDTSPASLAIDTQLAEEAPATEAPRHTGLSMRKKLMLAILLS